MTTIVFVSGSHNFLMNINEDFMFVGIFRVSIFDYLRAFSYVLSILSMSSVAPVRFYYIEYKRSVVLEQFPVMRTCVEFLQ